MYAGCLGLTDCAPAEALGRYRAAVSVAHGEVSVPIHIFLEQIAQLRFRKVSERGARIDSLHDPCKSGQHRMLCLSDVFIHQDTTTIHNDKWLSLIFAWAASSAIWEPG